jgi:hypothetical protein
LKFFPTSKVSFILRVAFPSFVNAGEINLRIRWAIHIDLHMHQRLKKIDSSARLFLYTRKMHRGVDLSVMGAVGKIFGREEKE